MDWLTCIFESKGVNPCFLISDYCFNARIAFYSLPLLLMSVALPMAMVIEAIRVVKCHRSQATDSSLKEV